MLTAAIIGVILGCLIGYRVGYWHSLTILGKAERHERVIGIRAYRKRK